MVATPPHVKISRVPGGAITNGVLGRRRANHMFLPSQRRLWPLIGRWQCLQIWAELFGRTDIGADLIGLLLGVLQWL